MGASPVLSLCPDSRRSSPSPRPGKGRAGRGGKWSGVSRLPCGNIDSLVWFENSQDPYHCLKSWEAKVLHFSPDTTSLQFFTRSVCHANYKSKLPDDTLRSLTPLSASAPTSAIHVLRLLALFWHFLSGHVVSKLNSIKLMQLAKFLVKSLNCQWLEYSWRVVRL